jgi:ribosomal-protein-alanine N-acetyltransferase
VSDPVLLTPRLALQPCTLDDVPALHALWTDPDVRRWLWDDMLIPEASARDVVEESLVTFAARGFGQWIVRGREDGALRGFAGLRAFGGEGEVELLYGLAPAHWGEGVATEAARAVLDHGLRGLGLPRIAARADSPNAASVRVMVRLGLRFEGERLVQGRPTMHYAIGREEWLAAAGGA